MSLPGGGCRPVVAGHPVPRAPEGVPVAVVVEIEELQS
jgi:hypothetical protein